MKRLFFLLLICVATFAQIEFDKYFEAKTLRIDYFHSGTKDSELYSIDELRSEPFWGGSKVSLIDKFGFGKYKIMVLDSASNEFIPMAIQHYLVNGRLPRKQNIQQKPLVRQL